MALLFFGVFFIFNIYQGNKYFLAYVLKRNNQQKIIKTFSPISISWDLCRALLKDKSHIPLISNPWRAIKRDPLSVVNIFKRRLRNYEADVFIISLIASTGEGNE